MSNETKFTKGDWSIEHGSVVIIDGYSFEMLDEYDASLIAAAPKLYAMLEMLLSGDSINDHAIELEVSELLREARGEK